MKKRRFVVRADKQTRDWLIGDRQGCVGGDDEYFVAELQMHYFRRSDVQKIADDLARRWGKGRKK